MTELQRRRSVRYLGEEGEGKGSRNIVPQLELLSRVFDEDNNGLISKEELLKIVRTLHHLIPDTEKNSLTSPEALVDEIMTEIDIDEDGVITEQELVKAVMRAEHLTTIVVDKIVMRFSCACINIINKPAETR